MGKSGINHLKDLTDKIRMNLPRLMEKTEGCIVVTDTNIEREITIGRRCFDISSDGVIIDEVAGSDNRNKYQKIVKVVGHEPQLGDVIEYFMNIRNTLKDDVYFCNNEFVIGFSDTENEGTTIKWDLSKPFLKDQDYLTIYGLYHIQNNSFD